MAWKNAMQYAGKLFSKQMGSKDEQSTQQHQEGTRQDAQLPLGAQIGGVIHLQMSPFIRAMSNGSLLNMPEREDGVIRAISRLRIDLPGNLYRYYLTTDEDAQKESFVQVYEDVQGNISELMYYQNLTRIIPETVEDQEAFTGSAGYGLGDISYTLWREQLEHIGKDASALQQIFGAEEGLEFTRDAGDPAATFITPFQAVESRIDDASGQRGLIQDSTFMTYSRPLAEQRESLLISTEYVQSKNGDRNLRDLHVDFMIGIAIETDRLLIQ